MNKLQICQEVNTLSGVQGSINAVENVSGYQATIVTMVDRAYRDIQNHRANWKFMRLTTTMNLSDTVNYYDESTMAKPDELIYDLKNLTYILYDEWIHQDEPPADIPYEYTLVPGSYVGQTFDRIETNPLDAMYNVDLYYYRKLHTMPTSTDVPVIPEEFHSVIVYKALITLGMYLGQGSIVALYTPEYNIEMGQMMRSQVPNEPLFYKPFVPMSLWYNR